MNDGFGGSWLSQKPTSPILIEFFASLRFGGQVKESPGWRSSGRKRFDRRGEIFVIHVGKFRFEMPNSNVGRLCRTHAQCPHSRTYKSQSVFFCIFGRGCHALGVGVRPGAR